MKEKKSVMRKRPKNGKRIGRIQLIIGLILIVGGGIGLFLSYTTYKTNLNENLEGTVDSIKLLKAARALQFSNETFYLGYLSIVNHYEEQNSNLIGQMISFVYSFELLIILAILFITQGLLNSSKARG